MEKKLKNAADKIKMPDDMKQRIISAAELAEKQRVKADNDDYIEVVRSSERITTKTRLIKTVSAIAACAVLVGGIGTTGFLLHRQNKGNLTSGEVSGSACRSCPFGDFVEFDYSFDAGDGKYGKYSDETYAKLSDFLNKFNWGSEAEAPKDRDINADVEEKMYDIKWTKGDTPPVECNIHIANDGYVCYMESMMDYDGAMKAIEEKWYKIDFEAFNNGIKDILAKREGGPTPFGDFTTFDYKLGGNDAKYNDMSAETRAKLSDFLNKFDWGEEMSPDVLTEEEKNMSTINLHQLESRGNGRLYDLAVFEVGYAVYNVSTVTYVKGEGEVIEQEYIKLYRVDYEAFDRGITDILTGKSDTAVSDTLTGEVDRITTELGERCETDGWEYLIKNVDVTKSGEGMTPFKEGYYSCNENGDLTCDSSYIIADMELTNKSSEDRSLYMNSTRIDLYNYNAEELDFKTSMEATAYTFNGEHSIYAGDFFKTDFKAGETKTFRVGYVIDDEYLDKNYDIIRIEINHSGVADNTENIRYYKLGENTNLNVIAQKQAKPNTEAFEYAELLFGQHERLTPTDVEGKAKFEDFVRNDFVKMLEPTSSDDIVSGITYSILTSYSLDDKKSRQADYFIFTDGFVACNEYKTDENGKIQLTNTEKYKIDVDKLESVLKDEIGVELPEYREININKVD
ncbi:hypothetical protein [Ruminococcus flavefaciens]|uniref:hypothetical protein n=1 Tax=Ruminococcus flavefaciens TaxID=1265 RepID=UPI0026EF5022|nr:hypothetical protein [Ruminococcus flavefaciens]